MTGYYNESKSQNFTVNVVFATYWTRRYSWLSVATYSTFVHLTVFPTMGKNFWLWIRPVRTYNLATMEGLAGSVRLRLLVGVLTTISSYGWFVSLKCGIDSTRSATTSYCACNESRRCIDCSRRHGKFLVGHLFARKEHCLGIPFGCLQGQGISCSELKTNALQNHVQLETCCKISFASISFPLRCPLENTLEKVPTYVQYHMWLQSMHNIDNAAQDWRWREKT